MLLLKTQNPLLHSIFVSEATVDGEIDISVSSVVCVYYILILRLMSKSAFTYIAETCI